MFICLNLLRKCLKLICNCLIFNCSLVILGRTIVLGQFTGVSLDGDVFLNIIDVRNEWLSVCSFLKHNIFCIKNIYKVNNNYLFLVAY